MTHSDRRELELAMEINGETKLTGIIGYPLTYTISPHLHNAAFDALGLNIKYVPMVVNPEFLPSAVSGLKALGFIGVNVTMPHKERIMGLLDHLDREAEMIGAVNTVVFRDGAALGYNTDGRGFIEALSEAGFSPGGTKAAVIGAGGAARAVVAELAALDCEVTVINRTVQRARDLVADLGKRFPNSSLKVLEFDAEAADRIREAELVVNSTPVGMVRSDREGLESELPIPVSSIRRGQVIFDLVYTPLETQLLREAGARGAKPIGGLRMLVHQAAASFEIWTGMRPPLGVMDEAAARALEEL